MIQNREFAHPLEDLLLLLQSRLHLARIHPLLIHKLEVIIRVGLIVPDVVKMVERTDQG